MRLNNVCIIGMGYVGLTLAVVMAEREFKVTGVEVNSEVCKQLNNGNPHFHEKKLDVLLRKHLGKRLFIQEQVPEEAQDAFIICVGTPTYKPDNVPVLDYITRAAESITSHVKDGSLIVLRSTVPVGTTRNLVKPILDKSGKKYGLAFCPERTAEGAAIKELVELPQIVGGIDHESVDLSSDLFRKICPTILEVSSVETAEMIKLLNNAYRDLTFAFANEVALMCEELKLDAVEAIRAANLGYIRSNIPVPGFVGGACLEKDPHILAHVCRENSCSSELVLTGRKINEALPDYVTGKVRKKLLSAGKQLNKSKIFIMGFGFKGHPETDDMRGSPTIDVVNGLKELGCENLCGQDFVVKEEELKKKGVIPTSLEEGFRNADCVIFANNHPNYFALDIERLIKTLNKPAVFIDVWHIFDPKEIKRDGIIYGGVGVE